MAERVIVGFLIYAVVASLAFGLSLRGVLAVAGLNLTAASAIVLLNRLQETKRWASIVRDWLPACLILLAYRESGLFYKPDPRHHLDYLFIQGDRVLLQNPLARSSLAACSPWLQRYFELFYLLCYPLVPAGFAVLYLAARSAEPPGPGEKPALLERRRPAAFDEYWTAVLLATLTCYAIYPFFPLTPPRLLFHDFPGPPVEPLLRKANSWILDRYSVQACIFPSGHVAAVTSAALSIRAHLPRYGAVLLFVAGSIALATVFGRYHYAADSVAGALVAFAAYFLSRRLCRPA